jgi:ATP-binding cassette subfamily B protein
VSYARAERPRFGVLLWPHVRPRLRPLAAALALSLLIAGLGALQPLLTRAAIDDGLLASDFTRLLLACGAMVAIALAGLALGGLHRAIYVRASGHVLFALRGAVFEHLLRVSPRRLARHPVGDLVARLDGDVAEVQRFGTDAVASAVGSVLALAAGAVVMLALSWWLALVVLLLLPVQLLVRHWARPRIERTTRDVREQAGRVGAFLVEALTGARSVQGAAAEPLARSRLDGLADGYLERVLRQQLVGYGVGAAASMLGHLTTAAIFVLGGWGVLHGALTVGTLIAFVTYLGRVAGSASALLGVYTGYQRARVSLERVGALLAYPAVADRGESGRRVDGAGALRLEHVCVGAEDRRGWVLRDVDLDVPAGAKVLLVGPSGAGKSTLADLLRRFLEPDAGRVLLDGRPLAEYRLAELRRRIVVVEHAPWLFAGTILDNLRYGHPEAAEAAVLEAAVLAGVDEFVRDLPLGYATPVGEAGAGLSTGQRQRIAIARAALSDPLVVVLDEATSGLDLPTARGIHAALDTTFARRTRIVITHHVQHAERCDLRLRLQGGVLLAEPGSVA